jgi:hypothetical protein
MYIKIAAADAAPRKSNFAGQIDFCACTPMMDAAFWELWGIIGAFSEEWSAFLVWDYTNWKENFIL